MVMDLITSYYAIGNNNVSEEGMYIFIMCYVHILQYLTVWYSNNTTYRVEIAQFSS